MPDHSRARRFPSSLPQPIRALLILLALGAQARDGVAPSTVTLDFGRQLVQLDGPDGASVCQFHASDPKKGTVDADRTYATLGGFPDDGDTDFGRFCDVAFSTHSPRGMGLSQLWSTPAGMQTPPGSIGKRYSPESWKRLDFSVYEPGELPSEKFLGRDGTPVRGHTSAMLLAAARRARREDQRILFWSDLHTDYPHWMWEGGLRKNPIPERYWEEAALHTVYYVKYLAARHGIPVHAVSVQNEPDLPARHGFTPEALIRISAVLRCKLDEAGLEGVRILPFTSMTLNTTAVPWMGGRRIDTLERAYNLLEGPLAAFQPNIDYMGGHLSHNEPPIRRKVGNIRFWRASGDQDTHWKDASSVTFDMGPDDQIDELIRTNTWLYGQGVSLAGIWQVALRMGHTVDKFVLPSRFDLEKTYRRAAVAGAATVNPFVRPGMFLVGGSLGRGPREEYSVDGFGGRGKRETIVVTNSGSERTFRIRVRNAPALVSVQAFQATASTDRRDLGHLPVKNGEVVATVPADSVTALVASRSSTRRLAVVVAADARDLSPGDRELIRMLEPAFEVRTVSQVPAPEELELFATKRHPVDAMGAAVFVLSDSVSLPGAARAHRTVMAPVVAAGGANQRLLGLRPGTVVKGGEPLAFRDELDPPAALLESGLPKACGPRAAWDPKEGPARLAAILSSLGAN